MKEDKESNIVIRIKQVAGEGSRSVKIRSGWYLFPVERKPG